MPLRNMRNMLFLPAVSLACLLTASSVLAAPKPPAKAPAAFKLTSTAFTEGKPIPAKYAQKGKNISPPLSWTGAPEKTKSFALLVEDPDAPRGTWVHWVVFNIPAARTGLPEGVPKEGAKGTVPGIVQGKNSAGHNAYDGPAPPSGTHHYYFRLYALDIARLPGITLTATAADVRKAMKGHLLGNATLMGTFSAK